MQASLPICQPSAQVGPSAVGAQGRFKDFECLSIITDNEDAEDQILVTCGSNGTISIWRVLHEEMMSIKPVAPLPKPTLDLNQSIKATNMNSKHEKTESPKAAIRQIGRLLGSYETNERITCLKAFVMQEEADERSEVDEDHRELDFDALYPDDTTKSDSEEAGATSDDSSGETES